MTQIIEDKACQQCSGSFQIHAEDIAFYNKISPVFSGERVQIPKPSMCPPCREQRRLVWKNELHLYKNICHGCGIDMISRFHKDNGHKNYCHKCWASDAWDARDYGQEIDFNRKTLSQISDLVTRVPFQALIGSYSNIENNATYTNCTADIKDSYMVSESDFVDHCFYGRMLRDSSYLFDCLGVSKSEICYECIHSDTLYNCLYTKYSSNCSNSQYLEDCSNCQDCLGCINLSNQKYHILNTPYSKQEYFTYKEKLKDPICLQDFHYQKKELFQKERIHKNRILESENSSGNFIFHSKNIHASQMILGCEDIRYCSEINDSQDLMDVSSYGSKSYKMFESQGVGRYSHDIYFSSTIGRGENLFYCIDTKKSQDCFGCVNLKFARYCIFNKQYSRQEYEQLVPKIIKHMQKTGEWGQFFPVSMSPFNYKETLAHELYPLSDSEIQKLGSKNISYVQDPIKVDKVIPANKLPDNIADIPDDILSWAIECEDTKKPFRIIPQELAFYRKHTIAIPRKHPDERRAKRMKQ